MASATLAGLEAVATAALVAGTTSEVAGVVTLTGALVVRLVKRDCTAVPVGPATGIVPFVIGYLPALTVDLEWGTPVTARLS